MLCMLCMSRHCSSAAPCLWPATAACCPRLPRPTPAAERAAFLPYRVQGCVAWNSFDGWLVLFDDTTKLASFIGAVLQAGQLARGG